MNHTSKIIQQTQCWIKSVIIELNFCPFANREFINNRIRYATCDATELESSLEFFAEELNYLDQHPESETTLLMFSQGYAEFENFLDLIDYANQLLDELGYTSVYQLAHFHPDYCFEGEADSDAANYTNRSPFPTLHILREQSLQQAISSHPDTTQIPQTNIKLARQMGADKMQILLDGCTEEK